MNDQSLDFNIQINEQQVLQGNENQKLSAKQEISNDHPQTQEEKDREIQQLREKYNNYSSSQQNDFLDEENNISQDKENQQTHVKNNFLSNTPFDIKNAANPTACLMTVMCKLTALFVYFFNGSFTTKLILCTLFTLGDFYIVKNITAKQLVGMRWWTETNSEGETKWKFETEPEFNANKIDYNFFWYSQIFQTFIMGLFGFLNFITFSWFTCIINAVMFSIEGMNLYGFYKCRGAHQEQFKQTTSGIMQNAAQFVINKSFSILGKN